MQHKLFFLFWMALLSLMSFVVGVLALLGVTNVEIFFWSKQPVESVAGKIVWVFVSLVCLIVFLVLFTKQRQKHAPGK